MRAVTCSRVSSGCLTLALLIASSATTDAQNRTRALPQRSVPSIVSPLLDDAGLNDVQFVGKRRGWAVGDRGVIWRTDDGGQIWQLLASGVDCPLRGVCFLTDRVGWVVGGGITPHVGSDFGVVLGTTDGGDTWSQLANGTLPLVHAVQFFDLEQGTAVCESSARFPSGVIQTADGGKTWEPLVGVAQQRWRVGAFVDRDMGFVAGPLGRFTSVGGGRIMPPLTGAPGLRSITDATLNAQGKGWLAGDGGLILATDNGGVSWRPPEGSVPRELRDVMDFQAVAMRGEHVWLAGQPGSVVWHSGDGGRHWTAQETGITTPIAALDFDGETHGWAVGAMGTILTTTDGGQTWIPSRAANRRVALLSIHAHESRVSLILVTKYAGEQAYRMATTLMSRRDIGPDAAAGKSLDIRLKEAITAGGGVASTVDWAFPVAAPELDRHWQELIREWQLLTDNRLREVMLSRLVVQLRTWRPDVLIVDMPPSDDATTKLLGDAIKLAIREAADPDEDNPLTSLLHLPAWQVKRAYRRLPLGSEGDVAIDAFEFLPRLGASVAMAAADPAGLLAVTTMTQSQREAYEWWTVDGLTQPTGGRDFFAGLVLQPGGDARRELGPINERDLERFQSLANQQRNFSAYTQRHLDDERHAAQIIGQTKDIIGAAPPQQAATQLAQLADEYARRGQWEYAQTTLFELVERYPDQPAALEAMSWLFHFTASAEVSWQRLRATSSASGRTIRMDESVVQASVLEAINNARSGVDASEVEEETPSVIQQASSAATLRIGNTDQHAASIIQWQGQAERLAQTLEKIHPNYFAEPSMQFPVAALERALKHPRDADRIVNSFLSGGEGGAWNRIAAGEVWISQPAASATGKVALCHRTAMAPYLDGELDDRCWIQAIKVPLRTPAEHEQSDDFDTNVEEGQPFVQFAYDDGFLYVAAWLRRTAGVAVSEVELPGRTDDADLSDQDRLSLQLDVDRDYATYYRFDIDQRGWTSDACWENNAWNAQRYVAVTGDSREWRMELAIPLTELVAEPPQRGDTWAAAVVRVLPTVGVESWSTPAGTRPLPQGFGLLRFE